MMGRQGEGQGQFFYEFDLDAVVPADHLVRQIDMVLDLSWVHKEQSRAVCVPASSRAVGMRP